MDSQTSISMLCQLSKGDCFEDFFCNIDSLLKWQRLAVLTSGIRSFHSGAYYYSFVNVLIIRQSVVLFVTVFYLISLIRIMIWFFLHNTWTITFCFLLGEYTSNSCTSHLINGVINAKILPFGLYNALDNFRRLLMDLKLTTSTLISSWLESILGCIQNTFSQLVLEYLQEEGFVLNT